eukprot:COSAG02_NODE_2111_length_9804_cov_5.586296_9_plen_165_part_00
MDWTHADERQCKRPSSGRQIETRSIWTPRCRHFLSHARVQLGAGMLWPCPLRHPAAGTRTTLGRGRSLWESALCAQRSAPGVPRRWSSACLQEPSIQVNCYPCPTIQAHRLTVSCDANTVNSLTIIMDNRIRTNQKPSALVTQFFLSSYGTLNYNASSMELRSS